MTVKPTFDGSLMFPSAYVAAEELKGRDVNVTISKVEKAVLPVKGGGKEPKYLLHFKDAKKPLVLNKTNGQTIAQMHGTKAEKWVGKRITLYPTTCQSFGEIVSCIRIRDRCPDDTTQPQEGFGEAAEQEELVEDEPADERPQRPSITRLIYYWTGISPGNDDYDAAERDIRRAANTGDDDELAAWIQQHRKRDRDWLEVVREAGQEQEVEA